MDAENNPEHSRRDRSRVWSRRVGTLDAVISEDAARRPLTRRERNAIKRRRRRRRRLIALGGAGVVALATFGALQLRSGDNAGSDASPSATRATTTTTQTAPPATLPPLAAPYSQAMTDENRKPGTTAWRLTHDGAPHDIEGYLSATSAQRGETVDVYATTVSPSFTIEAYRMGWYQGLGGRLVWTSAPVPGKVQAPATLIPD